MFELIIATITAVSGNMAGTQIEFPVERPNYADAEIAQLEEMGIDHIVQYEHVNVVIPRLRK